MLASLASGKNNDSVDLNLLLGQNDVNLCNQNRKCLMARQPSPIFKPNCYLIRTFGFLYIVGFIRNVNIKNT